MKVLAFFVHGYRWGEKIRGDERRFLEVAKEFRKAVLEIYTIERTLSLQHHYYGDTQVYFSLEIPSNPCKLIVVRTFAQILYTILFIVRVCHKLKFDAIYAHNQDLENVILSYIAKLISRRPLIVVLHSVQDFKFSLKELFSMYRGSVLDIALLSAFRIFGKLILRRANLIFAVSNTVREDAGRYLGLQRLVVSGNGVDFNKFRPDGLEKKYDAAFLGRVDFAQKGMDTLLKAWKVVTTQRPSAKLVIIGGFQDGHEGSKHLMNLVDNLSLRNNVKITGFVLDEEVIKLLNESKIFLFPTHFEGFGLSVLEAMSCGLPCIVSDIPVFRELHGGIAVLVPQDDIRIFAKEVLEILSNQAKYDEMSSASRAHALRFSWSNVAKKETIKMIKVLSYRGG